MAAWYRNIGIFLGVGLVSGCLGAARLDPVTSSRVSPALFGQFQAYDGHTGQPQSFRQVVERCRGADVILLGEEHSDPVCNQLEAQLLWALWTDAGRGAGRPVGLAMEFFECDTQAALDAYLRGRISESDFRQQTRQGRAYVLSHRPLIELCRAAKIPVIAANAPRRLVRNYRTSGLEYADFRARLDPAEQRWLPLANVYLPGPYEDRFVEMMAGHPTGPPSAPTSQATLATAPASQPASGPAPEVSPASMYRAQLLWDQSMAESLASFRDRFPTHQVLLVVGQFHVAHAGGTLVKFRLLRPSDRVVTVIYRSTSDASLRFDPADRHVGDILIYGIAPPPEDQAARSASTTGPTTPSSMPAAAQPAPASQPGVPEPPEQPPASESAAREIHISQVLAIGGVSRWGRSPVHTDAVESMLVSGEWSAPAAGQPLTLPDGSFQAWAAASADENGVIRHPALAGGYAYATVQSDTEQPMLLEAAGHSMVYVNGQPRVGDPYQTGFVSLPVQLRPGSNEFLFACARGELRAKLVQPRSPVMLDLRDATVPDLTVGQPVAAWAAVVVVNATDQMLQGANLTAELCGARQVTAVPPIPPWSVRKVGFEIAGSTAAGPGEQKVLLTLTGADRRLDQATLPLRVVQPGEPYRRTFISEIDGSVQFYAIQPARTPSGEAGPPAMFLSLHGAGVDALGQASSYANKSWGHVVAPTNRRPFGFDWEDWGRRDALEVLEDAERQLGTDPRRTYLTGHSMGGHGVWQVGAHCPDRFAAIAPSAGWISFWSYAGAASLEGQSPIETILRRAANGSDTLALSRNYLHHGVYILHGEADDNVPVEQARTMRQHLAQYHPNFVYYERPGAGHWWDDSPAPGADCVDWGPLFEFLRQNTRRAPHAVQHLQFVTASPAISATCCWATIQAQIRCLDFSRIDLRLEPESRTIRGTTENVAWLTLTLELPSLPPGEAPQTLLEPNQPLTIELDQTTLTEVSWPQSRRLHLARRDGSWRIGENSQADRTAPLKDPGRSGPFKEVFRNRVQLVYGTSGTAAENDWAFNKARYDAETFWVRGNGAIEVVPDTEFDPDAQPDRNIVLYGNQDTNRVWQILLAKCPIRLVRGRVQIDDRTLEGDDLALLAVYPRPGSQRAMVGMIGGSGLPGMRLTERLPYFVSGVAYPDWTLLEPEMLRSGTAGVRAAGFFNNDWQIDPQQSAWQQ